MNKFRVFLVMVSVVIVFIFIVVKLANIQLVRGDELKYYAEKQQLKVEKISAERGLIYDRNNVLMVYNKEAVTFYLDLAHTTEKTKKILLEKFTKLNPKSASKIKEKLKREKGTIILGSQIALSKGKELIKLNLPGFYFRRTKSREYYYNKLASNVLGYVNKEYKGINGIERYFNKELAGIDGERLIERDTKGNLITVEKNNTKKVIPGKNIYLTIDKSYQNIVQEELQKGIKKYKGKNAVAIIMNPNTGEILAMANSLDFNPNKYWDFSDANRKNNSIANIYEPGSTLKSITMAALLDQKLITSNQRVFAENGRYKFKNTYIEDTHKKGWLTAKDVITYSSNIGIGKLAQKIKNNVFYEYLRGFGFGNYTSISLPGEVKGKLKKPEKWTNISKEFMSFGYEISVTPIQLITAYSAIINGGLLFKPQIIKKISNNSDSTISNFNPKLVRRVISKSTSNVMRNMLASVVKYGTGKKADIKIIPVGGKTGTSQKLINGKYSKSYYNSSFIGFFPVDNPQILCLVLVDSPEYGRYGGQVAAPIFKNISKRIVESNINRFITKPELLNNEIAKVISRNKKNIQNSSIVFNKKYKKNQMPNLKNQNLSVAINLLTKLGVKYKIFGTGKIIKQSVRPGTKLNPKLVCKLTAKEQQLVGVNIY